MSKNVILVLTDQMRGDCLGANGNKKIMTPFLDDLANSGCNFTNAQSANPSCIPARASILTGLPAHKNGFYGYCDGVDWNYQDTLVDQLNERGYKTINVGKTHFYPQRNNMNFQVNKLYDPQHLDSGFKSDYHQWLEEVNPTAEDPAITSDNNGWPVFEWAEKSYYHPTEWTLRTGLDEIDKCSGEPFFMQLSFHRPHPPFDPPEFYKNLYKYSDLGQAVESEWSKEYESYTTEVHGQYGKIDEKYYKLMKEAYYASITHIDYQIGKLINHLRSKRIYNETLIIFCSDHGEMLGDHNMFRKATPFKGSIHIPMIINGPGVSKDVRNDLVTHIDLKPTILNYIGGKMNQSDGIDMLSGSNREVLVGEHPFDRGWHFIVTEKYKYIWDSVSGQEWCFDPNIDKDEQNNIIYDISKDDYKQLQQLLIDSFIERKLMQFTNGTELITGAKLPAFKRDER